MRLRGLIALNATLRQQKKNLAKTLADLKERYTDINIIEPKT